MLDIGNCARGMLREFLHVVLSLTWKEEALRKLQQASPRLTVFGLCNLLHHQLLSHFDSLSQFRMQASCQCGLVHFENPASEPAKVYICHCTECRHQSSSAFGISAIFSRESFERAVMPVMDMMIKDGDVKVYERATQTGRTLQCLFCSRCGSRLLHMGKGEEEKDGATIR